MIQGHRPILRSDYADFKTLLTEKGRFPVLTMETEAIVRRGHHLMYSLMLWSWRMEDFPPRGLVFLDDLAWDAVQILPQCLDGYARTPLLLIRGVIENAIRHAYFWDHAIEFERFTQVAFKISPSEIFEYLRAHPRLHPYLDKWDCIGNLFSNYGELSEHIHGTRALHAMPKNTIEDIVFEPPIFTKQVEILQRVTSNVNFMLICLHPGRVRAFDHADRNIILRTMPKQARSALTEH